jgi:hypothetical protein
MLGIKIYNMNVHLIRSQELSAINFNNICDYLNEFKGDIKFKFESADELENEEELIQANPDLVKRIIDNNEPQSRGAWAPFFEICESYRAENNIPQEELIILLTNQRNDNNYFGYASDYMNNVFIQTSNWADVLGEGLDDIFPIVYEIAAWTLRRLLFNNISEMISSIPRTTRGCIMDMCQNKEDISFKIRTGDISPKVLNLIKQKKISPIYMNQLIAILEKVRSGVMFRERLGITNGLTKIELREFGKRKKKFKLLFVDFGDIQFPLETLETAIYLVFLNLPEGIRLQDFDSEIEMIESVFESVYLFKDDLDFVSNLLEKYTSNDNTDKTDKTELLIQNISRINRKLNKVLPKSIASHYHINGERRGNYKIALDRELVDIRRL